MYKIYGFLLLIVNLYSYQNGMNSIVFFATTLFLLILMFFNLNKKKESHKIIYLRMMIFTLPFSWTSIIGSGIDSFPITWFYLLGLLFFITCIIDRDNFRLKKDFLTFLFLFLIIYSFIPLISSNNFKAGISDFLMILFFCLIGLSSHNIRKEVSSIIIESIIKDFIFINFISAIIISFQYFNYQFFNKVYFKMNIEGTYVASKMQVGGQLLYEDASSATLMLTSSVILALFYGKKKLVYYFVAGIILAGLAFTARRTGAIALLFTLPFYFIFNYKGLKRILSILLMIIFAFLVVKLLTLSRPVDNVAQLFDDNNRIVDYVKAIHISLKNPLGVGYGDDYIASLTGHTIPHNTFLRWLVIGGIIFATILTLLILIPTFISFSFNDKSLFWAMFSSIIGMNFIPDVLNARYIIVIIAIILLSDNRKKRRVKWKNIKYQL